MQRLGHNTDAWSPEPAGVIIRMIGLQPRAQAPGAGQCVSIVSVSLSVTLYLTLGLLGSDRSSLRFGFL